MEKGGGDVRGRLGYDFVSVLTGCLLTLPYAQGSISSSCSGLVLTAKTRLSQIWPLRMLVSFAWEKVLPEADFNA
jgi:hypothetical protein